MIEVLMRVDSQKAVRLTLTQPPVSLGHMHGSSTSHTFVLNFEGI